MTTNTYLARDKYFLTQPGASRFLILCLAFVFFFSPGDIFAQHTNTDTELAQLVINTNLPDSLFVVVDGDLIEAQKINSTDTIKVKAGNHKLILISNYYNDIDTTLDIRSDVLNVLNKNYSSFRIDYKSTFNELDSGHNTTILTDPESKIYVDSEFVGVQKTQLLLNPGSYNLLIVHPDHGSIGDSFEVDYQKETTLYRYNKNPKSTSVFMKLLPGGAYFSTGHNNKAYNTYKILGFMATSYSILDLIQIDKNSRYKKNIERNNLKISSLRNDIDQLNNAKMIVGIGAGLLYLYTTYDGFQKPENGYIIKPTTLSVTDGHSNFTSAPGLSVSIDF